MVNAEEDNAKKDSEGGGERMREKRRKKGDNKSTRLRLESKGFLTLVKLNSCTG